MYAWCYLLVKQMCFICQETGGCFYKSRFTGEAPVFTYKTLTASLDFLRLNLKWRFHTHTHTKSAVRHASESRLLSTDTLVILADRPSRPLLAATESRERLSVMRGWRFVILKRGSNGLSGY